MIYIDVNNKWMEANMILIWVIDKKNQIVQIKPIVLEGWKQILVCAKIMAICVNHIELMVHDLSSNSIEKLRSSTFH